MSIVAGFFDRDERDVARGYHRRAGGNESPAHLDLQSAAAQSRLGWPKTQITIVFPFHSGTLSQPAAAGERKD
jgi:hypothetical protein